ncbi:MAG: glycosyltransferase family protein [Firmicutes bacterium]|nr:glycosyltransferase family protein [Bacillota bacterium]
MAKVVAIIQARMDSTRLPGKVARLLVGKPLLAHIIARVKRTAEINEIVVATTTRASDDRVAEIARQEGIGLYRGSESDVLSRYLAAGQQFNADIVARITGDCPLIDPVTIDRAIKSFSEAQVDYLRLDLDEAGYPRGLDVEVFYYQTLIRAAELIKKEGFQDDKPYREHVTLYIYHHPEKFRIFWLNPPGMLARNYRLCVDEALDFQLIEEIYKNLYRAGDIIDINTAIDFLDHNPTLGALNQSVEQKKF